MGMCGKDFGNKEEEDEETRKRKEKQQLRFFIYGILFIVFILILFFSIRYFYNPEPKLEKRTYNGFEFVSSAGLWNTKWQSENRLLNLHFHYGPWEAEDVRVVGDFNKSFNIGPIYITFDPLGADLTYVALANGELSLNLAKGLGKELIGSCLVNETSACIDRPIVSCDDKDKNVIYFKEDKKTLIELKGKCVIIQGSGPDIVRAVDRLLYQWYEII